MKIVISEVLLIIFYELVAGSFISQSEYPSLPQTNTILPKDDEVVITAQEMRRLLLSIDAT